MQSTVYNVTTQQTAQNASSLRGSLLARTVEKTEGFTLTRAIRYFDSLYKSFIQFFGSACAILHDKLTLGKKLDSIGDLYCSAWQIILKNSCNSKKAHGED